MHIKGEEDSRDNLHSLQQLICPLYSDSSKTEVPRGVLNSKVRKQDKFRRDWSHHLNTCKSHIVGQDQMSAGVSFLCWHSLTVINVLWKPRNKVKNQIR